MGSNHTEQELRMRGDKVRREVLGDARVDATTRDPDAFDAPLIEYLTKYAWGDIWSRPGLDRRARSILNLGMLEQRAQIWNREGFPNQANCDSPCQEVDHGQTVLNGFAQAHRRVPKGRDGVS